MFLGPVAVGMIDDWELSPAPVVSWRPSQAAAAKARQAPISAVPPSYIQARHLRGFADQAAKGLDYSRLLVAALDIPGRCDLRAATYVVNAHLRRHDTYRSWFEHTDTGEFVRHTIADAADIEFVPTKHGELAAEKFRDLILATPDPLHWDCFTFGTIQAPDHFTFFVAIDHLHMDTQFLPAALLEIQVMYTALVSGAPPVTLPEAGRYDDYCVRQRQYTST
ncbi:MAG TPA: acyltransferase, partial [Mycobacterium sp.]|nr:acyltransferase [Mycobacterium sp.]